jgi:hypothetical protein
MTVERPNLLAAILPFLLFFGKLPHVGTLNESPRKGRSVAGFGPCFAKGLTEKGPGNRDIWED